MASAAALDKQAATMVKELRQHFENGVTRSYKWRREQIKAILTMTQTHKKEFIEAGAKDFNKPAAETDVAELVMVEHEAKISLASLAKWMAPESVNTPMWMLPATSEVRRDPFGVVLLIAPFNYPMQLAVLPLLNALVAGNTVVLKPSELTPHVSSLLAKLIPAYLDRRAVRVVEGGVPETTALLNQKWDMIFFTGSETVGRIVHQAAAKNLTPCILELGGKSPVIIDETVRDISLAARRIVWGKCMNAGQTCIAPDYVLVHRKVKDAFIAAATKHVKSMFGENPKESKDFARIVSERHATRIQELLKDQPGKVVVGGEVDVKERYVAPTIITEVKPDSKIMKEEIFGPLLPVVEVSSLDEALGIIKENPNPLALYVFSKSQEICDRVIASVPSGSVCVNDTVMQFACQTIPFGGVGLSGIGSYHGKHSYESFTHARGVLRRWDHWAGDIPLRYAPYTTWKGQVFRVLTDTLQGLTSPTTVYELVSQGTRGIIFALGIYQLLLLLTTAYQNRL